MKPSPNPPSLLSAKAGCMVGILVHGTTPIPKKTRRINSSSVLGGVLDEWRHLLLGWGPRFDLDAWEKFQLSSGCLNF